VGVLRLQYGDCVVHLPRGDVALGNLADTLRYVTLNDVLVRSWLREWVVCLWVKRLVQVEGYRSGKLLEGCTEADTGVCEGDLETITKADVGKELRCVTNTGTHTCEFDTREGSGLCLLAGNVG